MTNLVFLGGSLQNNNTDFFTNGYLMPLPNPRVSPFTGTEAQVAWKIDVGGTLSLLTINVNSNGQTSTVPVTSRVNSAVGNQSITIGIGATGQFQDTTHSDSILQGNTVNYRLQCSDGAHEIVPGSVGCQFSGSVCATLMGSSDGAGGSTLNNGAASVTRYVPLVGTGDNSNSLYITTETSAQEKVVSGRDFFPDGLAQISSNTDTNAATVTFRKGAANGNQTFSIGASTTGYIEDTTHSDAVIAGDLVNLAVVSGAGTVNANHCFTAVTFTSGTTSVDYRAGSTRTAGNGFSTTVANYLPILCMNIFIAATESNAQTKYPHATTFSNLIGKFVNSSGSGAQNLVFRKGGSSGNQTISIDPASPGTVQDTTHTDVVVANDLVDLLLPAINNSNLSFLFLGLSANSTASSTAKKRRTVFSAIAKAA